jgi:hypothetical protein
MRRRLACGAAFVAFATVATTADLPFGCWRRATACCACTLTGDLRSSQVIRRHSHGVSSDSIHSSGGGLPKST